MSKDPAFLFYPGDYLRDTQCLSEKAQVAYDRIMCEHMRNICLRQEQLNFFTKKLNDDEKAELLFLLQEEKGCFFIPWIRESIIKRREYSESRRKNRIKDMKTYVKDMKTYDEHMEIENEIEIENINKKEKEKEKIDFSALEEKELISVLENFIQHRKEIKKPLTQRALNLIIKQLNNYPVNVAIEMVETSIKNGWQGIFELKPPPLKKEKTRRNEILDSMRELAAIPDEEFYRGWEDEN